MRFVVRLLLNGVAILFAAWLLPGLDIASPGSAVAAGAILGIVNAIVRPVLLILTLPVTLLTLGLFILVINALCLALTAAVVPGFYISGFWAAFFGAVLISIVSWILNGFFVGAAER